MYYLSLCVCLSACQSTCLSVCLYKFIYEETVFSKNSSISVSGKILTDYKYLNTCSIMKYAILIIF